jgi:predicted enzyme related to lactoylglutathione lyase
MKTRVIHFEIQADDVKRAKNFYEKVFDWKIDLMMEKDKGGTMDYWGLTTGSDGTPGINGGLFQRPKENSLHSFDCTIQVDNIEEAIQSVEDNGGKIMGNKYEIKDVGWFARGTDTEGNTFGLMQPTGWQPH